MVADQAINELIAQRAQFLLAVTSHLPHSHEFHGRLTRPLLGRLKLQAIEMEEFLDAYGAKNNRKWHGFRSLVATTKLFADVGYELLHIKHYLPIYQLLPISRDFTKATDEAFEFTSNVLIDAGGMLLKEAESLSIPIPETVFEPEKYTEAPESGRLSRDIESRKIGNVYETITLLATNFLNLAKTSMCLQDVKVPTEENALSYTSSRVNSENLRSLHQSFHNLQSLYDTYVSYTDVEEKDGDLAVLRGHISVVFHLLKIAMLFSHYYERHVKAQCKKKTDSFSGILNAYELLTHLVDYAVSFSSAYIRSAEHLCKSMLQRYTKVEEVMLPVPVYRGFHVRPSTLVSEIVLHYGTEVSISFDDEILNAAIPLEIFRINEKINAMKRKFLAERLATMNPVMDDGGTVEDRIDRVRQIIMKLLEQGDLVLYEQPLVIPECNCLEKTLFLKQLNNIIAQLQAEGKLDTKADIKVLFIGDVRVLNDIQLLANSGYGEDSFGTNIPLPKQLSYLRS